MQFFFFDAADHPLFVREDAESAVWSVDQFSLALSFPFDPAKEILRGMRVGFTDDDGVFQAFEVRQAKAYEPDHYQEIEAEHIAVAELTDEFYEGDDVTDETAEDAIAPMLTNTLWQIGTVTDQGTSSVDIEMSGIWNLIKSVEKNWNVWVTPRVTVDSTGITGRFLDIAPAEGTWRGVRLSLAKNADNVGVTYDDSEVKTALYAFGREENKTKLTFTATAWEATLDHPGKPAGQAYLEDPTAKALYGRNGRNRFGYYQNSDITDPVVLLEKTWESLQTLNHPRVTVDCMVSDLHRLGYADQDIRLHDKVIVDLPEIGKHELLDVIKLEVDLLNPARTQPTIGAYIPNIIFIDREASAAAHGGYGKNSGDSNTEYERKEFVTEIARNEQEIRLRAYQVDLARTDAEVLRAFTQIDLDATRIESLATGSGCMLDEHGELVVDQNGDPIFITDVTTEFSVGQYYPAGQYVYHNNKVYRLINEHIPGQVWDDSNATEEHFGVYSKVLQNAEQITLKVAKGDVATQLTVEVGNVHVTGGNLIVDGYLEANGVSTTAGGTLTADTLESRYGEIDTVNALTVATGSVTGCDSFTMDTYSGDLVDSIKGVQIIASGNNYKLQYKTFAGDTWTDAGTFSRATLMSGTWASGVLTVLPDSAGSSSLYYYLSQGNTSWSGATGSIPVLYSTTPDGQTQSTGYSFTVNRSGSITANTAQSTVPTGTKLREVTVGAGGNHTYIRVSATGFRNSNDYIQINY